MTTGLSRLVLGELLQIGVPDEVVLRPPPRRVGELIGYLGFVQYGSRWWWEYTPERVTAGGLPTEGWC